MPNTVTVQFDNVSNEQIAQILATIGIAASESETATPLVPAPSAEPTWGPDQLALLRDNPNVAGLLEATVEFLRGSVPEANIKQNWTSMTIRMPGGLNTTLRPRVGGLKLGRTRHGTEYNKFISTSADLNDGLVDYLRNQEV